MTSASQKRLPRQAAALLVLAGAAIAGWLLLNREDKSLADHYTGYVISDNLYLSSPVSGTVQSILVKRGQRLDAGTSLFQIDSTSLTARTDKIKAQIEEAKSQSDVQSAELESAAAAQKLAASDLERLLAAEQTTVGTVSKKDIDKARETVSRTNAAVLSAQNRIAASKAFINSNQAGLREIERQLAELSPKSPTSGRVEELIYKPGEWVAANAPVISIVPDDEIKVRFYVPQGKMSRFHPGTRVGIMYDGGPSGLTAQVDFVSSRPEYTPPVIYSLETRDKLVFMVEAVPSDPGKLIPGQPIDVVPN